MKKLDMKLKVREPLDSYQEVFDTLNHIETLGHQSLTELASLHGLCFCSNPDQNNAQDIIANHFLSGDCVKTNGVFCDSVSSVSMSCSKECVLPDNLPVLILDGALKKVTKKTMLCVLHLIGVPHSPTDSISVHHKLLHEFIVKLHAERYSYQKKHVLIQTLSKGGMNSEVLAEVAQNWPQRVSHAPMTDAEWKMLELIKEVKLISANIPGSAASCLTMQNKIHTNVLSLGVPSFYITVNPADVYNPIVKYLSGHNIDIDNLMLQEVPMYWEQAKVVACNPCIAAEFFDTYLNTFFSTMLCYDPKQQSTDLGVVGVVKAYYSCIEAQGHGSLHCHMVVWVHGGLNSDEI